MTGRRGKPRRIDFYADDWIGGVIELSVEQRGVYIMLITAIYAHGGPIADSERWLAGLCGVSMRKWRAIRHDLIAMGKITAEAGLIRQKRCEFEIEKAANRARKRAEIGSSGGRKTAERFAKILNFPNVGAANAAVELRPTQPTQPTSSYSVSDDTGADAPLVKFRETTTTNHPSAASTHLTPDAALFHQGVQSLMAAGKDESTARTILGRWKKAYGTAQVIEAMEAAQGKVEPVAYIEVFLRNRSGSRKPRREAAI